MSFETTVGAKTFVHFRDDKLISNALDIVGANFLFLAARATLRRTQSEPHLQQIGSISDIVMGFLFLIKVRDEHMECTVHKEKAYYVHTFNVFMSLMMSTAGKAWSRFCPFAPGFQRTLPRLGWYQGFFSQWSSSWSYLSNFVVGRVRRRRGTRPRSIGSHWLMQAINQSDWLTGYVHRLHNTLGLMMSLLWALEKCNCQLRLFQAECGRHQWRQLELYTFSTSQAAGSL